MPPMQNIYHMGLKSMGNRKKMYARISKIEIQSIERLARRKDGQILGKYDQLAFMRCKWLRMDEFKQYAKTWVYRERRACDIKAQFRL